MATGSEMEVGSSVSTSSFSLSPGVGWFDTGHDYFSSCHHFHSSCEDWYSLSHRHSQLATTNILTYSMYAICYVGPALVGIGK